MIDNKALSYLQIFNVFFFFFLHLPSWRFSSSRLSNFNFLLLLLRRSNRFVGIDDANIIQKLCECIFGLKVIFHGLSDDCGKELNVAGPQSLHRPSARLLFHSILLHSTLFGAWVVVTVEVSVKVLVLNCPAHGTQFGWSRWLVVYSWHENKQTK